MAYTKTDAKVEEMRVDADGDVVAVVNIAISDDSTDPATIVGRQRVTLTITSASTAEKTAAASLVSKAQALAVAEAW